MFAGLGLKPGGLPDATFPGRVRVCRTLLTSRTTMTADTTPPPGTGH
jgi:hypothetical protein